MAVMPAAVLKKVVYNSLGNVVCESRDRSAAERHSRRRRALSVVLTREDFDALPDAVDAAVMESFSGVFLPSREPSESQVYYIATCISGAVERHLKSLVNKDR
jgi:hypothetical protein